MLNTDGRCASCGIGLLSDKRHDGDCYSVVRETFTDDNGTSDGASSGTLKDALAWFCPFANTTLQQRPPANWPARHWTYKDGKYVSLI